MIHRIAIFLLGFCQVGRGVVGQAVAESEDRPIDEIIIDSAASSHQFDFMLDENSQSITRELDMRFPIEQWNEISNLNSSTTTRKKRKGIRFGRGGNKWTGNVVPYAIAGGFSSGQRSQIMASLQEWMRYTCLTFRPASFRDTNKIRFQNGGGCYSMVGMTGGTQTVGLAQNCRIKRIIIHEVGHAIGFHHEQTRPDRDRYVTINYSNIPSGVRYNFQRYTTNVINDRGVPYDYYSIMHYGARAFSNNGGNTIVTKDPAYQNIIGRQGGLSFRDIKLANKMYSCAASCSKSDSDCPGEGFVGKDCKCWCPGSPYKICTGGGGGTGTRVTTPRPVTPRPTTRPTPRPTTRPTGSCNDSNRQCSGWASRGECTNNPAYMLVYCKRSCNQCGTGRGRVSCRDRHGHCSYWQRRGFCTSNAYRPYMATNCRRSCNMCAGSSAASSCSDANPTQCPAWARSGECQRNPRYMLQSCRRSCGQCGASRGANVGARRPTNFYTNRYHFG